MIDTARIIMFLECNFKCSYCCNEKSKFNTLFQEMYLGDIFWGKYKTVCVSGGEPFFRKEALYATLDRVPKHLPIFLYTNGILITDQDISRLLHYNIGGINVGVHGVNQIKIINPHIDEWFSVRYQAQDKNKSKLMNMYPHRLFESNTKFWKMDDCYRSNEDWILLKDYDEV